MQPYAEVEGALQGFGSPLAFCLWEALGGGGGGSEKEKKRWWPQRPPFLFFFLSLDPPPPQQPRVLFAYSFTLLNPFSSPIRKLLIAHAFPQIHEPPYPPFIIVLIARNLSGRIAASKNLKNHTYAKMGAPQRPFLYYLGFRYTLSSNIEGGPPELTLYVLSPSTPRRQNFTS